MYGLDVIYAPDAPLSYECHCTSEIEDIYNHHYIGDRSGGGVLWRPCNRSTSTTPSNQDGLCYLYNVQIFSAIGELVQCPNKNNLEDTLLSAARFEMAVPTACFKFTPAAPNITGYATRERHIFAMAITVQVGIYA